MVLLLLALIWGALLVSWLRSRSGGTFSDSVGTFRQHLHVLERATPTTVRAANRLSDAGPQFRQGPFTSPRSGGSPRPRPRPVAANSAALRRRQAQKRRRDVFLALVAGAAGSFLLALIPGLAVLWSLQVLFDVLLAAYVAVLVRMRNLAAERELKLRFMPASRPPARAAAPRRRTYDFGATGYGDLELRRAAN
jgi:hypothetical protein